MNTNDYLQQHGNYLAEQGISFVTDIKQEGKGAFVANTYFFTVGNKHYLIDPGCGRKRIKQIKAQLPFNRYDILVTHSHLDHSANSGIAAGSDSKVIFHPLVAGRINNLQRNYTGIMPEMIRQFGISGAFGRTGMAGPRAIKLMQFLKKAWPALFDRIVYMMSQIMRRIKNGAIYPPKKHALFLNEDECRDLEFADTGFRGWQLNSQLFLLETPGHQDDHLSVYIPEQGIMFSGDLISFLNPNDILDGSIKETRAGMLKMLQLAEAGGIDILAPGHDLPVIGKDNVVAYLKSVIAKQEEAFNTIAAIVADCEDKTDFEEIITKVYSHESDLIKRLIKINFPRSVSFIDVYVLIYLKEYIIDNERGSSGTILS